MSKRRPTDVLDMVYINSLPPPLVGRMLNGSMWPIADMDVETGVVRVDACGLLSALHICEFTSFRDESGVEHPMEGFFSDALPEDRVTTGGRS